MAKTRKEHRCKLLPYEKIDCLSMLDAQQKTGWGISSFNLPNAWKYSQGEGVVIAVLDTGADLDHPDLVENLIAGRNIINPIKTPEDDNGHGCVSGDSLVQTTYSGIEEIQKLYDRLCVKEENISHKDGTYTVKNINDLGIYTYSFDSINKTSVKSRIESIQKLPICGKVIKVTLEGGTSYLLTPWHPVYTMESNEVVRKRADEVKAGDGFIFGSGEDVGCLYGEHIPKIDHELAYISGVTLIKGRLSNTIQISSISHEVVEKLEHICKKNSWKFKSKNKFIEIYGKSALDKFESLGVLRNRLPEWVGNTPKGIHSEFLSGMIDACGEYGTIETKEQELANQISVYLNGFGVSSYVESNNVVHSKVPDCVIKNMVDLDKIEKAICAPRYESTRVVESVEMQSFEGFFYDFTVNHYHNYIANGHFVSNTHVTGILVGANNDIGMVGVCPKAKVMPIKVLDKNGNGNLLHVAEGIRFAADSGVNFITMSLGSPSKIQNVCKAIQYAQSKGVVTFVAAGNAGNTKEIFYPANYKETISIGAINENFERANFSCTGKNLDFMAPGADIFSTFPDNWYATLSGTSMACPFAVGVAALLLSYVKSGKSTIKLDTTDDYREIFKKYTTNITNNKLVDPSFFGGFGIIDPRKFIDAVQDPTTHAG